MRRSFVPRWLVRAGALCSVVLLLALVTSLLAQISVNAGTVSVGFNRGSLVFVERPTARPASLEARFLLRPPRWLPNGFPAWVGNRLLWRAWLPLWIPLVVVAVPTALLTWFRSRPYPRGHCPHCGYDLTGNVSGRCSECGTAVAARR